MPIDDSALNLLRECSGVSTLCAGDLSGLRVPRWAVLSRCLLGLISRLPTHHSLASAEALKRCQSGRRRTRALEKEQHALPEEMRRTEDQYRGDFITIVSGELRQLGFQRAGNARSLLSDPLHTQAALDFLIVRVHKATATQERNNKRKGAAPRPKQRRRRVSGSSAEGCFIKKKETPPEEKAINTAVDFEIGGVGGVGTGGVGDIVIDLGVSAADSPLAKSPLPGSISWITDDPAARRAAAVAIGTRSRNGGGGGGDDSAERSKLRRELVASQREAEALREELAEVRWLYNGLLEGAAANSSTTAPLSTTPRANTSNAGGGSSARWGLNDAGGAVGMAVNETQSLRRERLLRAQVMQLQRQLRLHADADSARSAVATELHALLNQVEEALAEVVSFAGGADSGGGDDDTEPSVGDTPPPLPPSSRRNRRNQTRHRDGLLWRHVLDNAKHLSRQLTAVESAAARDLHRRLHVGGGEDLSDVENPNSFGDSGFESPGVRYAASKHRGELRGKKKGGGGSGGARGGVGGFRRPRRVTLRDAYAHGWGVSGEGGDDVDCCGGGGGGKGGGSSRPASEAAGGGEPAAVAGELALNLHPEAFSLLGQDLVTTVRELEGFARCIQRLTSLDSGGTAGTDDSALRSGEAIAGAARRVSHSVARVLRDVSTVAAVSSTACAGAGAVAHDDAGIAKAAGALLRSCHGRKDSEGHLALLLQRFNSIRSGQQSAIALLELQLAETRRTNGASGRLRRAENAVIRGAGELWQRHAGLLVDCVADPLTRVVQAFAKFRQTPEASALMRNQRGAAFSAMSSAGAAAGGSGGGDVGCYQLAAFLTTFEACLEAFEDAAAGAEVHRHQLEQEWAALAAHLSEARREALDSALSDSASGIKGDGEREEEEKEVAAAVEAATPPPPQHVNDNGEEGGEFDGLLSIAAASPSKR